ncbi:MAG: CPBP family intramembrane metalloprotease [Bacilli bacterium]|nr:CPBP family intramembrane metalloprotease [Bacilli bacterium]
MKNFAYRVCGACQKRYDPTANECPHCHREHPIEGNELFEHDVHVGWIKNLLFLLVGFAGFQIIGYLVALFSQSAFLLSNNLHASKEELTRMLEEYVKQPSYSMLVNGLAYAIVFAILLLILGKHIKIYLRGFRGWKPYVAGLVGFFALIVTSISWSFIVNIIRPNTGENANQSTIVSLAIAYPVLSLLIFGVIGPVCEEFTYRIGLFSLCKRFSRILAYIVTPLVFGLIHFGWSSIPEGGAALITELLNIPDYIFAGVILAYLYDRYGIGASTTAHIFNNAFSFFQIFILHAMGQI